MTRHDPTGFHCRLDIDGEGWDERSVVVVRAFTN